MSMFIGRSASGGKLVITDNIVAKGDFISDSEANVVFSSNLNYITEQSIEVPYLGYQTLKIVVNGGTWYYYGHVLDVSSVIARVLTADYQFFSIALNNTLYTELYDYMVGGHYAWYVEGDFKNTFSYTPFPSANRVILTANMYYSDGSLGWLGETISHSSFHFFYCNTKTAGTSDIHISNNDILIGTKSIKTLNYVSTAAINKNSKAYGIPMMDSNGAHTYNYIYVTDCSGSTVTITSESIAVDGFSVFNHNSASNLLYAGSYTYDGTTTVDTASTTLVSTETYSPGELVVLVNLFSIDLSNVGTICTYKEGIFAYLGYGQNLHSASAAKIFLKGISGKVYLYFDNNLGTSDLRVSSTVIRTTDKYGG